MPKEEIPTPLTPTLLGRFSTFNINELPVRDNSVPQSTPTRSPVKLSYHSNPHQIPAGSNAPTLDPQFQNRSSASVPVPGALPAHSETEDQFKTSTGGQTNIHQPPPCPRPLISGLPHHLIRSQYHDTPTMHADFIAGAALPIRPHKRSRHNYHYLYDNTDYDNNHSHAECHLVRIYKGYGKSTHF